jgi:hypothetical protein
MLVVVDLQGFGPASSSPGARPLINTVLGAVALCFAVAVWIGWLPRPREEAAPSSRTWMRRHLRDLSSWRAEVAGVITHMPG